MLHLLVVAAAGFLGHWHDPDATRLAIDAHLRKFEHAMLAGDKEGYLAEVWQGDGEFLHEQTYFANDLTKKKPADVTLRLENLNVSDGSATGQLTWTWSMPEKKAREVAFEARWVEVQGRWLYAGETWERHEAPGVLVLCDPGLKPVADASIEAFSAVRAGVEREFGLEGGDLPRRTQKIKLYGSMKHLQQSICLSYEDSLGGWNEPGESIKMLAGRNSRAGQLKNVLAHEYGHVATFELGPSSNRMPWWVLEGVAELATEKVVRGRRGHERIQRLARQGRLAPWDDLADFENTKPQHRGLVYSQGHHMVGYIADRFGRPALNRWMSLLSNGKTMDEATQAALERPWAQLAQEWRESLPKEGDPEPEAPAEPAKEPEQPAASPPKGDGTR